MNGQDLFEAINHVEERFVDEAENSMIPKTIHWIKWGSMAACFCLLLFSAYSLKPLFARMESDTAQQSVADAPIGEIPNTIPYKEPPTLTIRDSSGSENKANLGTYSWIYTNEDGNMTGACADSSHPLEWQKFLNPITTSDEKVVLTFDVPPQEVTIRCWSDDHWGQVDAKAKSVSLEGEDLKLQEGGWIYEVTATWTGENLAGEGTAYYGFYVILEK